MGQAAVEEIVSNGSGPAIADPGRGGTLLGLRMYSEADNTAWYLRSTVACMFAI